LTRRRWLLLDAQDRVPRINRLLLGQRRFHFNTFRDIRDFAAQNGIYLFSVRIRYHATGSVAILLYHQCEVPRSTRNLSADLSGRQDTLECFYLSRFLPGTYGFFETLSCLFPTRAFPS